MSDAARLPGTDYLLGLSKSQALSILYVVTSGQMETARDVALFVRNIIPNPGAVGSNPAGDTTNTLK
jgi:hypothetical protein